MSDPKRPQTIRDNDLNLPGWLLIVEFAALAALATWAARRYLAFPWLLAAGAGLTVFAGLMVLLYKSRWFFWIYLVVISALPALVAADFLKFHLDAEWAWSAGGIIALLSAGAHWYARPKPDETT